MRYLTTATYTDETGMTGDDNSSFSTLATAINHMESAQKTNGFKCGQIKDTETQVILWAVDAS